MAVAKPPKDIISFVNYFVHNTNLAYVSRGKNGGIIRGTRKNKGSINIESTEKS